MRWKNLSVGSSARRILLKLRFLNFSQWDTLEGFFRVVRGHYLGEGSLFRRKKLQLGIPVGSARSGRENEILTALACVIREAVPLFWFPGKIPSSAVFRGTNPQLAGGAAGAGLMFLKHRVLYQRHFDFLNILKKGKIPLGFKAVHLWTGMGLVWWHLWEGQWLMMEWSPIPWIFFPLLPL